MLVILKRHYQFWFTILALHKIGATIIPATHLLTKKDVVYRVEAAHAVAVVCTADGDVSHSGGGSLPGDQVAGTADHGPGMPGGLDRF